MKRFAPAYAQLKQFVHEPGFGDPLSLHGMFAIGSRPGWDDAWFIKTGGIHYVDLCRYLFGEVTEVRGFGNAHQIQVDQCFTLLFEHGEIGGLFFAGVPAWTRHHEELTVTAHTDLPGSRTSSASPPTSTGRRLPIVPAGRRSMRKIASSPQSTRPRREASRICI